MHEKRRGHGKGMMSYGRLERGGLSNPMICVLSKSVDTHGVLLQRHQWKLQLRGKLLTASWIGTHCQSVVFPKVPCTTSSAANCGTSKWTLSNLRGAYPVQRRSKRCSRLCACSAAGRVSSRAAAAGRLCSFHERRVVRRINRTQIQPVSQRGVELAKCIP